MFTRIAGIASSSSGTHTYNNIFTASNVSIRELLQQSFNIRQELISGLPSWAEGARFDISAKIVDLDMEALRKLKRPQREMMLRSLLVERFGLKWHIETKSLPIYEMVVAKGGAKLKPNPETSNPNGSMSTKNNDFTAHNIQLISLAELLSDELQRPVRDKTGLDGRYDFELKWSRDESSAAPSGDSNAGDALPSFFTALQEQLGLKLQPAQGPVDTLVIDHLEVPTEN